MTGIRDDQGLVGFVNVIWDGQAHAFIEDTLVARRARRQGILGTQRHELVLMCPRGLARVPEHGQRPRKRYVHPGDEQRCQQGCGNVGVQHQIR